MKKSLLTLIPFLTLVFVLCFGSSLGHGLRAQTNKHSVTLTWDEAQTTVTGYNVYRGTSTGGPYSKLDSTPVVTTSYTDTAGTGGIKYYYVVTALDSSGSESAFSNEVSATFLGAPSAPVLRTPSVN